jgi:cytochrome c2
MFWVPEKACWVERVSMLEGVRDEIIDGRKRESWKTLFESSPCLPTDGENRRHGIPVVGYFGGGRMAVLGDDELLLTVGDFGFDGLASPWMLPQELTNSYGKTIRIRISDGSSTVFTFGQRNPQGLFVGSEGRIWSTEHGPQGGDELNLLVEGANYGWPLATFGTDYGSYRWPRAKAEGEHTGYALPVFAWIPSIGASQVIEVDGTRFPQWRGDLLVGSLRAAKLFRMRVRDGRTIYAEPIELGCRVRDLVEGADGNLVIWSDDCGIVTLQPQAVSGPAALFAEKCSGCHQSDLVSGNRIGPNLHGAVGRPIASLRGYPDYSVCLKKKGGDWSRESLDRFLTSPATFCPGTSMQFAGVETPQDRESIIEYLSTLSN